MITMLIYPKCSTCRNAVKWFEENKIPHQIRHIVNEKLTAAEIKVIHEKFGLPIKRFFNTSGLKYRELGLSSKIDTMTDEACYELLATDGMLVKRPLIFHQNGTMTLGFKIADYEKSWLPS